MEKLVRFTLGREERLKSRKTIEQLFGEGKAFTIFPVRVVYLLRDQSNVPGLFQVQAGFTVSTRHFKNATHRNRIRRLMKEAYRLQKFPLQQQYEGRETSLAVFFIYVGKELPTYELIREKMNLALQRLIQLS